MLQMNVTKRITLVFLIMLIPFSMWACGILAIEQPHNEMPTMSAADINKSAVPEPTTTPTSNQTVTPTDTPPPPTQTPLPFMALDGLRVAYIINGNLYVQDSGKEPVQLTDGGLDRNPIFSDDGEKILFYRGEAFDLYSINANGSQEQLLASPGWLTKLNLGYSEFTKIGNIAFVPGTHQLLFNTSEVKPWSGGAPHVRPMDVQPNQDILLMDIDNKEVKRLLAPGEGGIFQISPDGKLDIDYIGNYINVIGIYGQISRRHMITWQPSWDYEWTETFWSQDSKKFNFVAPIKGNADGTDGPEPDAIWQYSMESNSAVEIRLNPPPMQDNFAISPDGNWIVYNYFYYPGKTDESISFGVYIGNLRDGSSHLAESGSSYGLPYAYEWSPDSEHFIFENDSRTVTYLGNTQGEVTLLNARGFWVHWIDDQRYIYFPYKQNKVDGLQLFMGEISKEGNAPVVDLPASFKDIYTTDFIYVFVKPK